MIQSGFEDVLLLNGVASLAKASALCSMIDNELDDEFVQYLSDEYRISAVVTRAGGSGENLKNKILKNAFGAAEKGGIMSVTPRNRQALVSLIENLLRSIDSPLLSVSGGGFKIGLAVRDGDMAVSIFGTVGLPGLEVDQEIAVTRVLYDCLDY